jgi:hypothetical protein
LFLGNKPVLDRRDKAKKRWVYVGHVGAGFNAAGAKNVLWENAAFAHRQGALRAKGEV